MKQPSWLKKPSKILSKKSISTLLGLIVVWVVAGQLPPDSTQFISPVAHQIKLAGSFAELRTNHFHSGIDIKSKNGEIGDPILASETGFISRIKIQSGGYGRALYMDHPNGYTTVYAHLEAFNPSIESFVKEVQQSVQQFEVDIYVHENKYVFQQGQQIGILGNTGRSYAPHLHFEIRETASERPVLPSKFNINVKDDIAPELQEVFVYELDQYGNELTMFPVRVAGSKGDYTCQPNQLIVHSPYVGIGVKSFDRANGVWNKNGIYDMRIVANDSSLFYAAFDKIDFSESKAINAIIDYPYFKKYKSRILKLFSSACNPLSNYKRSGQSGILLLTENEASTFVVSIGDNNGNKSKFELGFQYIPQKQGKEKPGRMIQCGSIDTITNSAGTQLVLFEKTLYNDQRIQLKEERNGVSYNIDIINENSPPHQAFKLTIPGIKDPKTILVKTDEDQLENFGGQVRNGKFEIMVDEFGSYTLMVDDIPPTIVRHATTTKNGSKQYFLKVTDNLDYDSSLGDFTIHVFACQQWVIFNYDLKNDMVIIDRKDIDPNCPELTLEVSDHSKNKQSFTLKM